MDAHIIAIPNNKAGDEDATVVIPEELDAMLREMYPAGIPDGPLMPKRDPRNVSKTFCGIAAKAAVKGNGAVLACPRCNGDAECKRCRGTGKVGGNCTLHDLRRAFGTRWASKVPAQVLQRLMRHADIKTTMDYYADVEQSIMAMLWPSSSRQPSRQPESALAEGTVDAT